VAPARAHPGDGRSHPDPAPRPARIPRHARGGARDARERRRHEPRGDLPRRDRRGRRPRGGRLSAVPGSPALRLLLRLKLRGMLRRQWRRLRTPKGLVLTLIGCVTLGAWFGYLAFSVPREVPRAPETAELHVRIAALGLFFLSLTSALSNRGLYLHKSE